MEKLRNIILIGILFAMYCLNELGRVNYESSLSSRFTKFFASPTGFFFSTGIAIGMLLATWFGDITDAHRLQHFALILLWVWPAAFVAVFLRHKYGHKMTYWKGDYPSPDPVILRYQWAIVIATLASILMYFLSILHAFFWHAIH